MARSLEAQLLGAYMAQPAAQGFPVPEQLQKQRHIAMDETPISRGFRSRRNEQTPNDRLPDSFGGTDATDQGCRLDLRSATWRIAARQMELGRVRGAPSDHAQEGHPLRHQMVEARYDMARRDIRRSVEGSGPRRGAGALRHGALRRRLHNKRS